MLFHAWDNSPFYQLYYRERGIKRNDLNDISPADLPTISKELLMENFDDVVTDSALKKKEIEDWIHHNRTGSSLYKDRFVAIQTSGTTGTLGIFVYDRSDWSAIMAALVTRVSAPSLRLGKHKLAFYGATHGRFAGVSILHNVPGFLYTVQFNSALDSPEKAVQRLNDFQPDQLSGYSSLIGVLTRKAQSGSLTISPRKIIVSGDPLTPQIEESIGSVWPNATITNTYAASESVCIGARLPGQSQLSIFDDLLKVEIVDDTNQDVPADESGQVVITNLYNRTFPIIRYRMGDIATRGKPEPESPFSTIQNVKGRVNDALPIMLDNGKLGTMHPIVLSEFFVPRLQKIQFISQGSRVLIRYISSQDIGVDIAEEFAKNLQMSDASHGTRFETERVKELPNDSETGKYKLVKINH